MPAKEVKIKNPGAKGGKFYVNGKGNIVYGEKPKATEKLKYDPKVDFKNQFPSYEGFQKAISEKGLPEMSVVDYKKLYQSEHKSYMKAVKESGTKEVKGFSGNEQIDFLKSKMFLGEDNKYAGETVKQTMETAKANGIELTEAEAMKFYKKVKYEEKKLASKPPEKVKPPEVVKPPEPEVNIENVTTAFMDAGPTYDKASKFMEFNKKPQEELGLNDVDYKAYVSLMDSSYSDYYNAMDKSVSMSMINKQKEDEAQKLATDSKKVIAESFEYSGTYSLPKQVKFGPSDDMGEKLVDDGNPLSPIGKIVYWQHNPTSSKWEAGQIMGYDYENDSYFIDVTTSTGVNFTKSRPTSAIRVPMIQKTFHPVMPLKPMNKKVLETIPAMDSVEAKKYVKEVFEASELKDMKSGVTLNHDSGMIENLEVKVRYSDVNKTYQMEMKLRNDDIKKEFKDGLGPVAQTQQMVWEGVNENGAYQTFPVSNNCWKTTLVDGTVQYLGTGSTKYNKHKEATNDTKDSGWAIRDTVLVEVNADSVKDAGEAYLKMVDMCSKYISPESHEKLFSKPTEQTLTSVRNLNVLNGVNFKALNHEKAFAGKYDEINHSEVSSKIEKELGAGWEDKIKYKEVLEGYNAHVIEGYHKELEALGMKQIITGSGQSNKGGVNIVYSMMNNGGLSLIERHKQGVINSASSGHQDYHSGGAEYLFTRMVNESNYKSGYQGYQSSGESTKVVWKNEVMDRTDVFAYDGDGYGSTIPDGNLATELGVPSSSDKSGMYVSSRKLLKSQAENKHIASQNEVVFKKGISPKYIDRILLFNTHEMELYAQKMKEDGILNSKHEDGRLWTDVVVLQKTTKCNSKAQMTLTEFIKNNNI